VLLVHPGVVGDAELDGARVVALVALDERGVEAAHAAGVDDGGAVRRRVQALHGHLHGAPLVLPDDALGDIAQRALAQDPLLAGQVRAPALVHAAHHHVAHPAPLALARTRSTARQ